MQRSNLVRKSSSIDQNYERNLRQQSVSYLPSVFLSYIPVLIIFLLNTLFNALFPDANSILHTLILIGIFASSNLFGYSVLSAQVQFFPVYWRASLLANGFLIGFLLASGGSDLLRPFGLYTMSLSFFHMSEFVFTALYNHREVSTDSFLLNHSVEYGVAALASWIEFTIEALLCPSIKLYSITLFTGLVLVSVGELFRKLAMYTAGRSFNHYVQEERQSDHVLVTKGVYAIARHPSYLGWFIWSVGTQVLLANPVCAIIYTIVSWKFFKNRIVYEEYYLIKFFGKQYTDYQKRVWSGIPFVRGFLNFDEALD